MNQITISKLAIDRILNDPKFRQLRENNAREVPLLYYFQRSYSTLHDGTVIEHGDGFMLSFVNPAEIAETGDIAYKTVASEGVSIFIGGPKPLLSGSFTIGWSNAKFTLERSVES